MKNLFLILSIIATAGTISLQSCDEINSIHCLNLDKTIINKQPNQFIHPYWIEWKRYKLTEWNGYKPTESDEGSLINDEYYYKWVFETKKHGIFVTQHAISSHNKVPKCGYFNSKWHHLLLISSKQNLNTLENELRMNLGDEYYNLIDTSIYNYIVCSRLYLKHVSNVKGLTSNQYLTYKKNHLEIKILGY